MKYKYVVIGAGAAGLVVAIGLAKAKKKVLLIENNLLGGDCTNFGCIPSKTLIASSKIAHDIKRAKDFGINFKIGNSTIDHLDFDTNSSLKRVRDTIEKIRLNEDEKALKKIGVDTLKAKASFKTDKIIEAINKDDQTLNVFAKKIIIATGSVPFIPPINGLDKTPYDTNETIFNLEKIPKSLTILGAGAIGSELSQAFQRLGSKVTLIDLAPKILFNEDIDSSKMLKNVFEEEGISLYLNSSVENIKYQNDSFEVIVKNKESSYVNQIKSEKLLVATGRIANLKNLNLENAGIDYSNKGIEVDNFARTNKKHIFAIGDCIGDPFFTHKAENMARSVLFTLLVPFLKKKISLSLMPRVTFTDPEVASIGLNERQAIKKHSKKHVATYFVSLDTLDRAICENEKKGFVKIVTHKFSGEILGACIVAKRAGEMLSEIILSMKKNIKIHSLANLIYPYPTYSLAIRKAADMYLTQTIFKRKQ
ncbi:MAG: Mercuric reductase [Candidatus Anoxychlamydiales bacterium]|nr:Mercuric reductase [Candidatus Anoxychlamydiales bacterium]